VKKAAVSAAAWMATAVVAVTAPGCGPVADPYADAQLERQVRARLVEEREAARLGVVSSDGTVYLSGIVASAEQMDRAEALAQGVTGVRRVVNMLAVRPTLD
jgi:hyperosmotically inducible protein